MDEVIKEPATIKVEAKNIKSSNGTTFFVFSTVDFFFAKNIEVREEEKRNLSYNALQRNIRNQKKELAMCFSLQYTTAPSS